MNGRMNVCMVRDKRHHMGQASHGGTSVFPLCPWDKTGQAFVPGTKRDKRHHMGQATPPPSNAAPWLRPGCGQAVRRSTVRALVAPRHRSRRFRPMSANAAPPVYPASRGDHVPRPASGLSAVRPRRHHRTRRPCDRATVRPWRTSNTPRRRKCAAGFRQAVATVRPCAACQSIRQAVRHHRTRRRIRHHRKRATVRPCRKCAAGFRQPSASLSGDRSTAPPPSASRHAGSERRHHRPRRHHRKRRPFDRAGSVRRIPANVSERRKRASRPPFDRAPRLSAVRPCAASRFRQKKTPRPISERGATYPATVQSITAQARFPCVPTRL